MTKQELIQTITETIENMDDCAAVFLWNEYCDNVNRYDDRIEQMEMLPELFGDVSGDGLFNLLNRFYFGHDEMNGENSSANPNRDYFYFNGYGNIVSTDYPKDNIDPGEIAEWIVEHENALYNDEIQDILDEYEEGENDE